MKKIHNFPELPGVYTMKSGSGDIIYVGKAKSIRKRVRSYFSSRKESRPLLNFLVPRVADVEFIVTGSEKEALILENTLIKKYKPKYNISLKDDKTYFSLKITVTEAFPRLLLTRKVRKDKNAYFGPYSSSSAVRETIAVLRNIFPLRTCSNPVMKNRSRACLNYQIKKCPGPCMGFIGAEKYKKAVDSIIMFLNGDVKGLIKALKGEMNRRAGSMDFEEAARIRDQIRAIELTVEKQRAVIHKKGLNSDIIGAFREGDDISITLINIRGGSITSLKNHIFFGSKLEDGEALSSFIKQFYHGDIEIPDEIILGIEIDDARLVEEWLTDKKERRIRLRAPKRGEAARLLEMAHENAEQSLINRLKSKGDSGGKLLSLKEKLNLKNLPRNIECYDISNITGKQAVGSKAVMIDGALDKSGYRRYKIRTKSESDDYGMMSEVLKRRFERIGAEERRPDLILIDGGKGHLAIALKIFEGMGIDDIDVLSIAKEKKMTTGTKEERLYLPGRKNPVVISAGGAYSLLVTLRDEAHRFAITYHRKLRGKNALASVFDGINGIGPAKKTLLLTSINSLEDISESRLNTIKGLSKRDIANILESLKFM